MSQSDWMVRLRIFALASIFVLLGTAHAEAIAAQAEHKSASMVPVADSGTTHLSTVVGGVNIAADLATRIKPASDPVRGRVTACTKSRIPCSLVDEVRIRVAQTSIFVPPSIVLRLADVDRAGLGSRSAGKFELVLECGDASEAYTAHIVFDRNRVTQLDVYSDEAGELAERTIYRDLSHAFDD